MLTAGVDIGSLWAKAVIIGENGTFVHHTVATGMDTLKAGQKVLDVALEKKGVTFERLDHIVVTGYGRVTSPFPNARKITEITCHGKGASWLFPAARTVIDIGGQDSKAIKLDEHGNITNFAMNEKCAAGTGRFIEVMALAIGVSLHDIGEFALQAKSRVQISSICTVFAESEVISLAASGVPKPDIMAGIFYSIASRVSTLVRSVGLQKECIMTGGVAKNVAVVKALKELLGCDILIPQEPQIVGALGAALLARS